MGLDAESLTIDFTLSGNSIAFKGIGWSVLEVNGTWMTGPESTLVLPRPAKAGNYKLEIDATSITAQNISVKLNNHPLANWHFTGQATQCCDIPWASIGGPNKSLLVFEHPDAISPRDLGLNGDERVMSLFTGRLSLTWHSDDGVRGEPVVIGDIEALEKIIAEHGGGHNKDTHALMMKFESLGENCELGLVQRHFGAEPFGLFRFSDTPAQGLLRALQEGIEGIAALETLELVVNPNNREYFVRSKTYEIYWHTWSFEGQVDPAPILAKEQTRIQYLVRNFRETVASAERVLVLRDNLEGPFDIGFINALCEAISGIGPATLLWISIADGTHSPGVVLREGDGLLHAWIDRLTEHDMALGASVEWWRVILLQALQMFESERVY